MRTVIILLAAVLVPGAAPADEVFLKGGGQLSGRIVSRSETKIEVDVAVPDAALTRRVPAGGGGDDPFAETSEYH